MGFQATGLRSFHISLPYLLLAVRSAIKDTCVLENIHQASLAHGSDASAHRTIVLRNQGRLAMDGTASSINGCILMKFRVSSGNSLDTLYFSADGVPAQQPGLKTVNENKI